MKKKLTLLIFAFLICFVSFSVNFTTAFAKEVVYLGGFTAGFSISTQGASVLGLCDVICEDGVKSPAKDCGILANDIIISIDNFNVNSAKDIENIITNGNKRFLMINRNEEYFTKEIIPVKDVLGNYKLGVYIRDDINGIGTITFIKNEKFASLGHPVIDDRGCLLKIQKGSLLNCNITGCIKGERGKAGELRGIIDKSSCLGSLESNTLTGVYGKIENNSIYDELNTIEIGEAKVGQAYIYTTLGNSDAKYYEISIVKVDNLNKEVKNYVIKINDENLLNITGGIVQGMSGSPIIQNNKLVGAVTHVFINDPTRGFGISIKNMLNNM